MKTLREIQRILTSCLPYLQEQYAVTQLGIFGSYSRKEQTPSSDLDLLVEFNPDAPIGLLTFCELENYLSDVLGLPIDFVPKDSLRPHIGDRILQDVIYL
ncbi:MAG: nucleotidyltransferase family protein [Cyanobacteria bacterium J06641_5]